MLARIVRYNASMTENAPGFVRIERLEDGWVLNAFRSRGISEAVLDSQLEYDCLSEMSHRSHAHSPVMGGGGGDDDAVREAPTFWL